MTQTHLDLQHYLDTAHHNDTAFNVAISHIKNLASPTTSDSISQLRSIAEKAPEPFEKWLTTLATQSWHYTLQETSHYINDRWQTEIMPTYHSQIDNRFPLDPQAKNEIQLDQFSKFLGAKGTLASFYQHFLMPFIDTSAKKWQWKKVENEQLPFSDVALNQIQNAIQLEHTLFPHQDNQLFVKFALQPIALDKNTKNIQLNINGQPIQWDESLPPIPQILAWPGDKNSHTTSLQLLTADNHALNNTLPGDWGWFKLINSASTQMINQKELLLNLEINGHRAKYLLFTQGAVNPFFALNFQQLKLAEQLS